MLQKVLEFKFKETRVWDSGLHCTTFTEVEVRFSSLLSKSSLKLKFSFLFYILFDSSVNLKGKFAKSLYSKINSFIWLLSFLNLFQVHPLSASSLRRTSNKMLAEEDLGLISPSSSPEAAPALVEDRRDNKRKAQTATESCADSRQNPGKRRVGRRGSRSWRKPTKRVSTKRW